MQLLSLLLNNCSLRGVSLVLHFERILIYNIAILIAAPTATSIDSQQKCKE
jgi:hypothetical protein